MHWLQLESFSVAVAVLRGSNGLATIAGVVLDTNGEIVRNARVFYNSGGTKSTQTNSSGAFVLESIPEGIVRINAELNVGGVNYVGENHVETFANERTKNLVIVIGREGQQATMEGTVTDRFGAPLEKARVHANAGYLGSSLALTDRNGRYSMSGLFPGSTYDIQASGRTYVSDNTARSFSAGQRVTQNFVLSDAGSPTLQAPNNLSAVVWTSPRINTSMPVRPNGVKEMIRKMLDTKRGPRHAGVGKKPKNTAGNNPIEVDLFWDTYRNDNLLGYGIYRGTSQTGNTTGIEYFADPLANFFADSDRNLNENTNYYYEITALNSNYPDFNNSESDFSNRYGVRPIGDMTLRNVTTGPLTFNWSSCRGAEKYTVFLFNSYPDMGVSAFWPFDAGSTAAATTTGTSLVYTGPGLTSGRKYYYVVLALANADDSRSISAIGSFNAP
ncbi:MAG: carboxypeptidase-like regulatory domain-containing protein [Fimbriimonadaceae bacterium]